jgi:hypothetical protein
MKWNELDEVITPTEPPQMFLLTFLLTIGESVLEASKRKVYSGTVLDPGQAASGLSLCEFHCRSQHHLKKGRFYQILRVQVNVDTGIAFTGGVTELFVGPKTLRVEQLDDFRVDTNVVMLAGNMRSSRCTHFRIQTRI